MAIKCNIHINGPQGEVYRPGSVLSGLVKYTLTNDMRLERISMSVKGKSRVSWTRGAGKQRRTHRGYDELIIDNGDILRPGADVLRSGTYQATFRFELPRNAPPTYGDRHCTTEYYIKITFSRSGFLTSAKKFKRMIIIGNAITPTLPLEPADYWLEKKVTEFFTNNSSRIHLKVNLSKSCLKPGEVMDVEFEVDNDTKHVIPSIVTRLMEKRIYRSNMGHEKVTVKKIKIGCCDTGSVKRRSRGQFALKFCTPAKAFTVQNCRVFSREYYLRVVVKLPMPHRDGVMDIPVQIGDLPETNLALGPYAEEVPHDEPPPSYWELKRRTNLTNDLREGRPSTATTEDNVNAVRLMIETDKRVIFPILHKHLPVKKHCIRWTPYTFTEAQKLRTVTWWRKMMQSCVSSEPSVITGSGGVYRKDLDYVTPTRSAADRSCSPQTPRVFRIKY
ncbi:Arrestin domain-containing protein 3 [Eumeta japonica]|uniref:Arrestin domain-containing protein 3 n=1 Tax=Eumeta variegata TaxID=151549 RepID=A0A4C1ULN6_EUMVA|nr:Arrestin domain-containing protein 3 [Eumeta japonica]